MQKQSAFQYRQQGGSHAIEEALGPDDDCSVLSVFNNSTLKPFNVELQLEEIPVSMVLDTGTCRTLLTHSTWKQLGQPKLHKADHVLTSYTGHKLPILGSFPTTISHNGQVKKLEATVV